MAARKKRKTKSKKVKKKKKAPARKKAGRKTKAAGKRRVKAKKAKPKARTKAKSKAKGKAKTRTSRVSAPAKAPAPAMSVVVSPAPPGERIGTVTHYFTHLGVAIVQLESGSLRDGDTVHIKGHTSDFRQRIESMELDHMHVSEAHAGQSVGVRVSEHAREHDVVYKVA